MTTDSASHVSSSQAGLASIRAGLHTCPACGHTMPATAPHLTMHRVVSHSGAAPITTIEGI